MNTEMASTLGSHHKNELYVFPVARNHWVPNIIITIEHF